MKALRPHRFPPLAQLHQLQGAGATVSGQVAVQAAVADGFKQGQARGYEEGHASGLQAGIEEAQRAGRAQGLAQGAKEMRERFEGLAQPLDALFAELKHAQQDYQAALRQEVVELVARVARQVIRCELTLQPTQLLALVDETLASMPPAREGVEVHLNPEDLQRIQELAPERTKAWQLVPDASLDFGECRVHAGGREADAGCRQRLAACMKQVSAQLIESPEGAPLPGLSDALDEPVIAPALVMPELEPAPEPVSAPAPAPEPAPEPAPAAPEPAPQAQADEAVQAAAKPKARASKPRVAKAKELSA